VSLSKNAGQSRPDGSALTAELKQQMDEGLALLDAETRAALWLHIVEGEGIRAVAASLAVPRSTVADRIAAGVRRLREFLQGRGFALPVGVALAALLREASAADAPLSREKPAEQEAAGPTFRLWGIVYDVETSLPIAGAMVRPRDEKGLSRIPGVKAEAVAGDDGEYELVLPTTVEQYFQVSAEGYITQDVFLRHLAREASSPGAAREAAFRRESDQMSFALTPNGTDRRTRAGSLLKEPRSGSWAPASARGPRT